MSAVQDGFVFCTHRPPSPAVPAYDQSTGARPPTHAFACYLTMYLHVRAVCHTNVRTSSGFCDALSNPLGRPTAEQPLDSCRASNTHHAAVPDQPLHCCPPLHACWPQLAGGHCRLACCLLPCQQNVSVSCCARPSSWLFPNRMCLLATAGMRPLQTSLLPPALSAEPL